MSMINAEFKKVSYEQFKKDFVKYLAINDNYFAQVLAVGGEVDIRKIYDNIKLPTRGTKRSSGYDFYAPFDIVCQYNKTTIVPTGIRIIFNEEDYDLSMFPRSGQGCKYRIGIANTVGIIDNDYWESDNEGHIIMHMISMADNKKDITIPKGKAFCQGIIRPFCRVIGDEGYNLPNRNGGHGSTDK